jgi:hypothetical protein
VRVVQIPEQSGYIPLLFKLWTAIVIDQPAFKQATEAPEIGVNPKKITDRSLIQNTFRLIAQRQAPHQGCRAAQAAFRRQDLDGGTFFGGDANPDQVGALTILASHGPRVSATPGCPEQRSQGISSSGGSRE